MSRRNIGVLIVSNLLGGVGVASSITVGALLVESLGATMLAGTGQAVSVAGAAIAAIPLAAMAAARGRRWALTLGYGVALTGALVVIAGGVLHQLVLALLGLCMFGVAQAVNLQSRYAAADQATPESRGRIMSVVIWATTVGSVAGPNLSEYGDRIGQSFGLPHLVGPYMFSIVAFALAATVLALFFRSPAPVADRPKQPKGATWNALKWAKGHPVARFAVTLTACAHAVMVMVMSMTPLYMNHHGMSLGAVGIVISAHILGMYALSPVFGWLSDVWGAVRTAVLGMVIQLFAVTMGFVAAGGFGGEMFTGAALVMLGLGWSAAIISASSLLASVTAPEVRIPLQGATDAGMNLGGAFSATLAGPILALGGFHAVNVAGALVLLPALITLPAAIRAHAGMHSATEDVDATGAVKA